MKLDPKVGRFDKDGYPNEDILDIIEGWPHTDLSGLVDLVEEMWKLGGFTKNGKLLELHTSGWSGNESIVAALQNNWMFWSLCWLASRRGGHYEFIIPDGTDSND